MLVVAVVVFQVVVLLVVLLLVVVVYTHLIFIHRPAQLLQHTEVRGGVDPVLDPEHSQLGAVVVG